jgi:hypothetical protein
LFFLVALSWSSSKSLVPFSRNIISLIPNMGHDCLRGIGSDCVWRSISRCLAWPDILVVDKSMTNKYYDIFEECWFTFLRFSRISSMYGGFVLAVAVFFQLLPSEWFFGAEVISNLYTFVRASWLYSVAEQSVVSCVSWQYGCCW